MAEILEISVRAIESDGLRVGVLSLTGHLDFASAAEFTEKARAAIEEHGPYLVLDMADLEYVSSRGVSAMLDALGQAQSHGGALAAANLQSKVKQILSLLEVNEVLPCCDSVEEAIRCLSTRDREPGGE